MKTITKILILFFCFSCTFQLSAQNCDGGEAQYNLDKNNVSVQLNTTGSIWWDGQGDAGYEFPKGSGRHLLFSGGLWFAGEDDGGNIKLAAQLYGSINGEHDFYPGPIDQVTYSTSQEDCANWDNFFATNRVDIESFLVDFNDNGQIDNPIPESIRGWPAKGNSFFEDVHFFSLPGKSLAPFVDQNQDNIYDPLNGDYPKIKGTEAVWWVYNDIGNIHSQSDGDPIGMEIQTMAYVYDQGNDVITNTTFYEYKMINYGLEPLFNFHTSFWADPDIGCGNNDYIGCHPESNLAYAYNASALDPDCGSLGYGSDIPMVGIKILETNITNDGMMSGFSYYLRGSSSPPPPPGTSDPNTAWEIYNYMKGLWQDGTPLSQGGNGYSFTADPYPFAFDNSQINGTPWTECTANLPPGDRRFLMNFGPVTLNPGAIRKLNFAVVTKADAVHPCPDVDGLIDDSNFVAAFDSLQTDLLNNPNTPGPFAAFSYEFQTQEEITFIDASLFNPDQWTWDFGDGSTGTENSPSHTYAAEGTYTVCLTASNNIGTDTYCRDIIINIQAPPVVDFDFNINNLIVIFSDLTANDPLTRSWDFGDGGTSTAINPFHIYSTPDIYQVCLTATNAAGDDTVCKEVNLLPTSVNDLALLSYTLYPNPAKEYLYINFTETISPDLEIKFFDVLGKTVNLKSQKNDSQFEISINELTKGLYFFELIENGKKRGSGKFVVE